MKSKFVKCGWGEVGKQLMDRIIQELTSADESAVTKTLVVILQGTLLITYLYNCRYLLTSVCVRFKYRLLI